MKNNYFINHVVWITGASSGIGEALAYAFSKQGANLILSSRKQIELERVKQNCNGDESTVFLLPLDLSHADELELKAKQALEKWGHIDILIHNAGMAARDFAENINQKVDRAVMETNYFGPIALTKAVLPSMIQLRRGHIVVISSLSGKYGVPKLTAYSASKHALHGFFDSLRTEVSKHNVEISIIIPGFIKTAILNNALDGKGNLHGKNLSVNEKGMSPETCAKKIIRAIRNEKEEALIGGVEILSVYLNRFFPAVFSKIIRNNPVRKLRFLTKKSN